ncbi:lanthionine synthetase LanC family protein [Mesorhizobium cantuariense]|uniref:Lanthionine synthetase LanC family protein n=1 Tax=Mesorhizobium cantuariense TaxID=1300275 RepID=A0ABV7MY30_9HYPH
MSIFLEAAARIGTAVCRSAHWDREGELCNWVGRLAMVATSDGEVANPQAGALGPELYGGTSGVALFLAELFGRTGEPEFGRTALGAVRRALRQCERSPNPIDGGYALSVFDGALGVAYAAWRVALRVEADGLAEHACALLIAATEVRRASHPLDVIGGNSGAIAALLTLHHAGVCPDGRDLAVGLAEELCRVAIRRNDVAIWQQPGGARVESVPLTGFAHGAAGIGLALLEAHGATGRTDFLEISRRAFAYEDRLFEPVVGNWPDFRCVSGMGHGDERPPYAVAWCHGAPGIALSRLRAMALDPARRDDLAATARAGLRTTLDTARLWSRGDVTLCHGLAGLSEILMIAGLTLDDETYAGAAQTIARGLIETYSERGNWPTGTGGPTPSLMLGTAGIGYHFLRLDAPELIPTILVPGSQIW